MIPTKFCPRCKSTDISVNKDNPLQWSSGLPVTYVCNNCNYKSYSFPEADLQTPIEKSKFEKSTIKKKTEMPEDKEIDVNYGTFWVKLIRSIKSLF